MENNVNVYVVRTIRRIRITIAQAVRLYQSTENVNVTSLLEAKQNLRRISTVISADTFTKLLEAIESLLLIKSNKSESSYVAPRIHSVGKGRPIVQISRGQLELLYNEGCSASSMAKYLGCSKQTIYKKLYNFNMPLRGRYSQIINDELKTKITQIHHEHPNAGQTMIQAYLKAAGINVQRNRIRSTLNLVDPVGIASRWSQSLKRRTYKVATPNSLWHMDAHLKISRWGFVIHGCIDGYSRLIIYLQCEMSIQAEPVVALFCNAVGTYGLPSRVRSDHGYENILVAFLMNAIRGSITGKSVHNQRIERLWVDVYKEVCEAVYMELYALEDENLLDISNHRHTFCIQYVYKPYINKLLATFQSAWNVHHLRTENNRSPRQIWLEGILQNYNTKYTAVCDIFENNMQLHARLSQCLQTLGVELSTPIVNYDDTNISSFASLVELNESQATNLQNIMEQEKTNKEKYLLCVNILNDL